jgi:hypothetical protein
MPRSALGPYRDAVTVTLPDELEACDDMPKVLRNLMPQQAKELSAVNVERSLPFLWTS